MNTVSTGDIGIDSVKCCIVFDSSTGEIQHVHRVVTIKGATETPDDEVARRALALAREFGFDVAKLEALRVDPGALKPAAHYRVDVRTKSLVQEDISTSTA